jgi:hypothetical protein
VIFIESFAIKVRYLVPLKPESGIKVAIFVV